MRDEAAIDRGAALWGESQLETARIEEAGQRVGAGHLLASLDSRHGCLRHTRPLRELALGEPGGPPRLVHIRPCVHAENDTGFDIIDDDAAASAGRNDS
jgi:hypothetical protein